MQLLNLSLPRPEENLALDEALLDEADEHDDNLETLRFWEMPSLCVVLGRSSFVNQEVYLARAEQDRVPVLRRATGGSTVLAGPGCLMYSLILSLRARPHLRMIDAAHREVIGRLRQAMSTLLPTTASEGICDLTLSGKKYSGNALRIKRNAILYHGTILYGMPLDPIGVYLREPPRQPEYREKRNHLDFVTSVTIDDDAARAEIARQWQATSERTAVPLEIMNRLIDTRYSQKSWHLYR
jgi:lipoate---protein ligase